MKPSRATVVALTVAGILAVPATAGADSGGVRGDASLTPRATGLSGPRQLNEYRGDSLVVAESDTGEISSADLRTGAVTTLLSGLYNPQGVDYHDGLLFIAVGGPPPPDVPGPQPQPGQASAALIIAKPGGQVVKTVDLLRYELAHNPDGQVQFVDGAPVDALSNPFSVLAQDERVLVADAGANDVLAVNRRTGKVSTFFVPPTVKIAACDGAQANPGTVGCDPVPTGVVEGPDGLVYVSTLGAEVPGAARIYVLNQRGHVVRVIKDLTGVTGVAVGGDGVVYAPELTAGAPQGPPPAGFDPSTVGQLVRIDRHGKRTYAQVTTPSSVVIDKGRLYSTANSVGFAGPVDGSLVRVGSGAFSRTPQS